MPRQVTNKQVNAVANAVKKHGSLAKAAQSLDLPVSTVRNRFTIAVKRGLAEPLPKRGEPKDEPSDEPQTPLKIDRSANDQIVTLTTNTLRTEAEVLEAAGVDLDVWDVERCQINKYDQVAKKNVYVIGDPARPEGWERELAATELWQVKIWLKRKTSIARTIGNLLEELKNDSRVVPSYHQEPLLATSRRAYELCLMDPHLGMHCFKPGSDHAWSMTDCHEIYMWALENLIESSKPYWPLEEIVVPMGNDLFHVDNLLHTTTGNTPQPEADSYYEMYQRGVQLCIAALERLKQIAPVKVKIIQGNHDRLSTFTLGHVLWAYYHNDANVSIDASSDPYKFYRFGTNLIGYDHGHSVAQVRMAALMANEVPDDWAATSYREWHCGDQHRKGSSKPTAFEEQGVSVEYMPGLTPPNEWHRLKSYNWQKRGALGFVWDYYNGPIARLQCNINSYTGRPTGEQRAETYRARAAKGGSKIDSCRHS